MWNSNTIGNYKESIHRGDQSAWPSSIHMIISSKVHAERHLQCPWKYRLL